MPTPTALAPPEQLVYTSGACHLFCAAALAVCGGTPSLLVATDPRQLEQHGWPSDEPLDLHLFLTLPDGRVVDAEGVRTLPALLEGFGVEDGYTYELKQPGAHEHPFGKPDERLTQGLKARLQALGWGPDAIPEAQGLLASKRAYRAAQAQAEAWWPKWKADFTVPEPGPAPAVRRKPKP